MPMIGQRAGYACQATLEGGMRKAGVEMDIVFRSNDNSAVQAMVRAGMGHAVMARLAVDVSDPGVLVRELVPSIPPRVITLVRRAQAHPIPAAERFIELTHEVCGEIMPGAFASDMAADWDEEFLGLVTNRLPAGRLGDPRELAGMVVNLASDQAGYTTGALIPVDGGRTAVY